jgi:hypothetical protein
MNAENLLSISKLILYIGTFLVAGGSIAVAHFTAKTDEVQNQKIDSLLSGNMRLEDGNRDLALKVDAYQADLQDKQREIEELKKSAAKAKRGLISQWDFNGARREGSAGKTSLIIGPEFEVFNQIIQLEKAKRYPELLALVDSQLAKTPDWLTPRLFKGIALANLGHLVDAKNEVQAVVEASAGDPAYSQAIQMLEQLELSLSGKS